MRKRFGIIATGNLSAILSFNIALAISAESPSNILAPPVWFVLIGFSLIKKLLKEHPQPTD